MSILIDERTRVIVQGFTGEKATFHAREMIAYGTNVVGSQAIVTGSIAVGPLATLNFNASSYPGIVAMDSLAKTGCPSAA